MTEFSAQQEWIPLLEYAVKKDISLSTLRRYIKGGKIPFRVENGRYLLLFENGMEEKPGISEPTGLGGSRDLGLEKLEIDLKKAREEITELKMLVALYEEKIATSL